MARRSLKRMFQNREAGADCRLLVSAIFLGGITPGMAISRYLSGALLCVLLVSQVAPAQEGSIAAPAPKPAFQDIQRVISSPTSPGRAPSPGQASSGPGRKLTIRDAEQLALRNHPRITIGELNALAAKQAARQMRAALLPTVGMSATGVTTYRDGNRITSGLLNNPSVFDRAGAGLVAGQLITDFGRTQNLYAAANLRSQAEQQTARATLEQIVFAVDQAFYDALSADVLVKVAEQTVQ